MQPFEFWQNADLQKGVPYQNLTRLLFTADSGATRFGVRVLDNGAAVALSGTVTGYAIRADGATLSIIGTASGNTASIVLPKEAYTVPGALDIVIKLTASGNIITLGAWRAYVQRSSTDTIVDPGTILPSIDDLIARIDAAVASVPQDYAALSATVDNMLDSDMRMAWINGSYGADTGSYTAYNYRITTMTYDLPEAVMAATVPTGMQCTAFAYQSDGTYIGTWSGSDFVKGTVSWHTAVNFAYLRQVLSAYDSPRFRIVVRYTDRTLIDPAAGASVRFSVLNDEVCKQRFARISDDAKQYSVEMVTGTIGNGDGLDFGGVAGRIRSKYIDGRINTIECGAGEAAVFVYNSVCVYLGAWTGTDVRKSTSPFFKFIDLEAVRAVAGKSALMRVVYRDGSDPVDVNTTDLRFYGREKIPQLATVGLYMDWAVVGASYDSGQQGGEKADDGGPTRKWSWPSILARRCGNTLYDYAYPGRTVQSFWSTRNYTPSGSPAVYPSSLAKLLADPAHEMYVLTLGGNRGTPYPPMGTVADADTDNPTTWCGYYGCIVRAILEHAPQAKVILSTPTSPTWWNTGTSRDLNDYRTAVIESIYAMGEHFGLPVICWADDPFMRTKNFLYDGMEHNHPTGVVYSGMALAFDRLFGECVEKYPDYFKPEQAF